MRTGARGELLDELLARRAGADAAWFGERRDAVARLCHRMAERFARGGRLLAVGTSATAVSDARHVAVEFVHPVIVGKRALPALAVVGGGDPPLHERVALVAEPDDIVMAVATDGPDPASEAALAVARGLGCLTVSAGPAGAEWTLAPPGADPAVRQELAETLYHLLWELVHVFFEHRGLLEGREARAGHDSGASSFLYPFLSESEVDLDAVLADVSRSVAMKADEVAALRARTLIDGREALGAAAADLRAALEGGGTVLALGNGGSATDAMDAVADLRAAPQGWPARRAIDLSEDAPIITAVANDVGAQAIFARQVIAYGRPGDALLAFSTSGSSPNVLDALAEARRREMRTVALVGYDGGRVAAEDLADHVIVTRSEHIPRIQEAQASAWHALRELIERAA